MSSDRAATDAPSQSQAKARRRLLRFVLRFWVPQWRAACVSMALMAFSGGLAMLVPFAAREVAAYKGPTSSASSAQDSAYLTEATVAGAQQNSSLLPHSHHQHRSRDSAPFSGGASQVGQALGDLTERVFGSTVLAVLSVVPRSWLSASFTDDDKEFLCGLLSRCGLMAAAVIGYHVVSLCGHLMAYRAGAGAQAALLFESLRDILSSPFPERIAVVNPAQLTHIIVSSGRTTSDILGTLLTDVLSSFLGAVAILGSMLYISVKLTTIIGVLVLAVQYVYYMAGRTQHARAVAASHQEAVVQASVSNAIQRSETVYVFGCRDFILGRLQDTLAASRRLNDSLNWSIHGYACASTSSTTLIFVVVLGISSFLHRKGDLDLMDIGLYFMFVRMFVSQLLKLSQDVSKMQADLGRLETLRRSLEWYSRDDEDEVEKKGGPNRPAASLESETADTTLPYQIVVSDTPTAAISLDEVTFTYPTVPPFIASVSSTKPTETEADGITPVCGEESAGSVTATGPTGAGRGIHRFSVSVTPGTITALYGPSGCGKSTSLRLLARLVRPQSGVVHTHANALLLEQHHAIFLGSIAENILLEEDTSAGKLRGEEHQTRVRTATTKGGCTDFIKDPFRTVIENVDTPPFSGGQLQRVCLARIFDPKRMNCSLVLLDEPTTGLDAASAAQLLETVQELRDTFHKTVLIATHDERVANIADTVIRLSPV